MRKFKWVFVFVLVAWVQRTAVAPPPFLGTKTPYSAPAVDYTPVPAGLHPVFVNYVGRHGARFLTKAGADIGALRVLDAAAGEQGLTLPGQRVRAAVKRLCLIEQGQYENITLLGAAEQRAIGQRMLDRYPGVFQGRGLDVRVTFKTRTRQSADAFLQGFGGYRGVPHFSRAADSQDAVLRFYDLSPAYVKYKKSPAVKKAMDSLDNDARTAAMAMAVCSRLFVPAFRARLRQDEVMGFADDLYDLYSVQFSLPEEIKARGYMADSVNLAPAFSREELAWEDFRSGAQDFLEKGPGRDPLGIQVKVAAPLLADFIRTTDAMTGGGVGPDRARDAVLRFTHAEAISPFASLLGIPEASMPAESVVQYHDHWQAEKIIPLSANIQWIIYSNGKDFFVKVLLNEREVRLPMGGGPYYSWKELREYCLQRLAAVRAGLGDDMLEYLKALK